LIRARYPDAEGFIERDGVRVGWEVYEGPGPSVLFCPQPPISNARGLKTIIPYVSRHFRVVVVEGRGNGRSDRPKEPAAYSASELTQDSIDVMDATDTESAIPISWSPRAIVGLKLCVEHPERALAAIFVTPDLWPTDFFLKQFRAPAKREYADEEVFNPHLMRANWREFMERWARRAHPHPHSTRQIENWVEYGMGTDAETFITSLRGTRLPDRESALAMAGTIRCPVFVLQNGGGSLGPKDCSTEFAAASGGELHIFQGLGPAVASRWPVTFNLKLREILERVRTQAGSP
jgi:pimeloyl-ACP methyl ester carboxylesterase